MSISKNQQAQRAAVCATCPQNIKNRCLQCGCKIKLVIAKLDKYIKIENKDYLIRPACRLKKWPEYS